MSLRLARNSDEYNTTANVTAELGSMTSFTRSYTSFIARLYRNAISMSLGKRNLALNRNSHDFVFGNRVYCINVLQNCRKC